jgi:hypothetical protein
VLGAAGLLVVGLYGWNQLKRLAEPSFCTASGRLDPENRRFPSPEAAAQQWWVSEGPSSAAGWTREGRTSAGPAGPPTATPESIEDFEREGNDWRWTFDDTRWVLVSTAEDSRGWYVGGVNGCRRGRPV